MHYSRIEMAIFKLVYTYHIISHHTISYHIYTYYILSTVHLETVPGARNRVAFFLNCASNSGGRASCSNFQGDVYWVSSNMTGKSYGTKMVI